MAGRFIGSRSHTGLRIRGKNGTRPAPPPRGPRPPRQATATGSFSSGTHWRPPGGGAWYPRSGRSSGGGRGGAPSRPAPPKVDPRKAILAKILDTPQPRPAIKNPIPQGQIDETRKKAEERTRIKVVDVDLADYGSYEEAAEAVEEKVGFGGAGEREDGECQSFISYSPIQGNDQRGMATGRFCGKEDLVPKGERLNPEGPAPPGYVSEQDDKGHLIASRFHGRGVPENIVAVYSRANTSGMKRIENRAARHLKGDKEVVYTVEPLYRGSSSRPWAIHMQGIASSGDRWDVCVLNEDEYGYQDGSVCRAG